MENRELIIPPRFDSKDAAAGLRSIEGSGRAADDLGQAADAASARFRRAHASVQAASEEFRRLRRALQQSDGHEGRATTDGLAAGEVVSGTGPTSSSEKWHESGDGLRAAGIRQGDRSAVGQGRGLAQDPWPSSNVGGLASQRGVDLPDGDRIGTPSGTDLPPTVVPAGPGDGPAVRAIRLRATEGAMDQGPGEEPGRGDSTARSEAFGNSADRVRRGASAEDHGASLEGREVLAQVRRRQGSGEGAVDPDEEPVWSDTAGRMARQAAADYVGWSAGGHDGVAANPTGGRAAGDGPRPHQMPALQGGAEPRRNGAIAPEGFDLLEGIRRARASSMAAAAGDESLAAGSMMRPLGGRDVTSCGEHGPGSRFGGASTDVIERLLREQNELIRQDLRRDAHPAIAAPPPMRGGGIRM